MLENEAVKKEPRRKPGGGIFFTHFSFFGTQKRCLERGLEVDQKTFKFLSVFLFLFIFWNTEAERLEKWGKWVGLITL